MSIGALFLVNCGLCNNLNIMQGYSITTMKTKQTNGSIEKIEIDFMGMSF